MVKRLQLSNVNYQIISVEKLRLCRCTPYTAQCKIRISGAIQKLVPYLIRDAQVQGTKKTELRGV